jgi:hypothetical protein
MSTNLFTFNTGIVGHPFKYVANLRCPLNRHYPHFHESGNEGFLVLHTIWVDDGLVQIVADDDTTEWIWFKEDGTAVYTLSGWGSSGYAMKDALDHAYWKPDKLDLREILTELYNAVDGLKDFGGRGGPKEVERAIQAMLAVKAAGCGQ